MRRFNLLFLVLLCATACIASGQAKASASNLDTGSFLMNACEIRIKAIDDPKFQPSPIEATHALMCQSYLQGFVDGMLASSHDFCMKPVTQEDVARKYIAFMTVNPFFQKEDKIMSVALVVHPLYKCDAKKR